MILLTEAQLFSSWYNVYTVFEKIKSYQKRLPVQQLRDTRVLVLMAFGVIAVMVTWSGIKAVQTNYELQKQISVLEQQNEVQQLANNNLKLQNDYLNTDQYLDLSARQDFGLAVPGEKELLVPKNVALAHTIDLPNATPNTQLIPSTNRPTYQRNWQAWMNFFLHRPSSQ